MTYSEKQKPEFKQAINKNSIKLGQYCEDVTNNVRRSEFPFPEFNVKLLPREIFTSKTKSEIALTIMKAVEKYGFILASVYYKPDGSGSLFSCKTPVEERNHTVTQHYIAIAGVKYNSAAGAYSALIHNSWGGSSYYSTEIMDNYIDCNLLNAMFVLEPIY